MDPLNGSEKTPSRSRSRSISSHPHVIEPVMLLLHDGYIREHIALKHGRDGLSSEHLRRLWLKLMLWLMLRHEIRRGRSPWEKLMTLVHSTLKHSPLSKLGNVLLQLLQCCLVLLHLLHTQLLSGAGPPHQLLRLLPQPAQLLPALPLRFQKFVHLSQLLVQVTHVGDAMGIDELHGAGVLHRCPPQKAVDDSVHVGVAEGEHLLSRREHHQRHMGSAEGAELTGLLEKAASALGEGDLEVALIAHFLHLDLLASTAFLCS
ncbi:hypothetical protein V8G54_030296 [Vigna mungo]|uniref:Uncharacterized protein n=1 Tax=Vigna mungo TaxID=3915 RepID=A0AAQ3MWI7_VIGMU